MAGQTLFNVKGIGQVHFLSTAPTSKTAPTEAEITAGDDLTPYALNAITGNRKTPQYEDFAVLDSPTSAKVFVGATFDNGEMMFGASLGSGASDNDIRNLLEEGDSGYLIIMRDGWVVDYPARGYDILIGAISEPIDLAGVATTMVSFGVSAEYIIDELPAPPA